MQGGKVLADVERVLRHIAAQPNGQFMPVSELLDARCPPDQIANVLPAQERRRMERLWLWEKLWSGGTS